MRNARKRGKACHRLGAGICLLLGLLLCAPAAAEEDLRPLSPAEMAAAHWAQRFLAGQNVQVDRLDNQAIELRAGPRTGAVWRLMAPPSPDSAAFHLRWPSGIEDVLVVRFARPDVGPETSPQTLRASWEREPRGRRQAARDVPRSTRGDGWLALAVLGLLAGATARARPSCRAGMLALALGLACAPAGEPPGDQAAPAESAADEEGGNAPAQIDAATTRTLLAVRQATLAGNRTASAASLDAGARRLVALWQAQWALAERRFNDVDALLGTVDLAYRIDDEPPLAAWLRARSASGRGDGTGAALAYRHLTALSPLEVFAWERAAVEGATGSPHLATALDALAATEPRWTESLEALATGYAIADREIKAVKVMRARWESEPWPRRQLLGEPIASYLLLRDKGLRADFRLGDVAEPKLGCPFPAARPLPALGGEAVVLGATLHLDLPEASLTLPGGCALAPAGAPVLDATAFEERRLARGMARLAEVEQALATRRPVGPEAIAAVDALVAGHQWQRLADLTRTLTPEDAGRVPVELLRGRAQALRELGQRNEASQLLVAAAGFALSHGGGDVGSLHDLADLLVAGQHYDLALRVLGMARRHAPAGFGDDIRLRQVSIEKKLFNASIQLETPHFRILYPPAANPDFAREVADHLEAERRRLQPLLPGLSTKRCDVLLLDFGDFSEISGGAAVVGLFDGKIRLPFGQLPGLDTYTRSIITHELLHALLTDATADRAPRFFQEGLAQYVELGRRDANPLPDYRQRDAFLSFQLIEPALTNLAIPELAQVAYDEALWSVIFLADRWGEAILPKLVQAFRRERDPERALRSVLGMGSEELAREFLAWGESGRRVDWST